MATVLSLEKHKDLFKSDETLRQFAKILEAAVEGDAMRLVVLGEELVGALVSPEDAQERLRERIVKRLASNPAILDKLRDRLESDDIVE